MNKAIFVVLLGSLFLACGPTLPRVNNSNPLTYQTSIKQVEESVPEAEKDAFNLSMSMLAVEQMKSYMEHGAIVSGEEEEKQSRQQLRQLLHGKNYKQIISYVDGVMLAKMEKAQREYEKILQEAGQELLELGNDRQFQGLSISQNTLTTQHVTLTVKNITKESIGSFILGVMDTSDTIPFVAIVATELKEPLLPNESQVVTVALEPNLGWDKFMASKQQILAPQWFVIGFDYENGKELANEEFIAGLEEFLQLRYNYNSLVKNKTDWKSAFNVDNVAKGFFPL